MKRFALLPCALTLALAGPVAAQTDDQMNAQPGRCQVEPQGHNGGQKPPVNASNNDDSLSGELDPCDGVLQPPPTGDQGMATPPPDEGNTPVIKPGEVPAQPKQ